MYIVTLEHTNHTKVPQIITYKSLFNTYAVCQESLKI